MTGGYNTSRERGVRGETQSSPATPLNNKSNEQFIAILEVTEGMELTCGRRSVTDDTQSTPSSAFFDSYYIHRTSQHIYFYANMFVYIVFFIYNAYTAGITRR